MHEPLMARVRELEQSNRRWKIATVVLTLVLLGALGFQAAFVGAYGYHALFENRQALRVAEEARAQEMRARAVAEQARAAAEQAVREARKKQ